MSWNRSFTAKSHQEVVERLEEAVAESHGYFPIPVKALIESQTEKLVVPEGAEIKVETWGHFDPPDNAVQTKSFNAKAMVEVTIV